MVQTLEDFKTDIGIPCGHATDDGIVSTDDSNSGWRNTHLPIEEPLLPAVASGDTAAVSTCIDRYGGLVWSIARRGCADTQTAEDAVQDIFLHVWRSAARFDPKIASEKTFIAMIARRRVIDIHRRKKFPMTPSLELDTFVGRECDVAQAVETRDDAEKAAALLAKLPANQQRVIKMSVLEGKSHSTIATETGISLGTVKTNIRRGLLALRKSLFAVTDNIDSGNDRQSSMKGEVGNE